MRKTNTTMLVCVFIKTMNLPDYLYCKCQNASQSWKRLLSFNFATLDVLHQVQIASRIRNPCFVWQILGDINMYLY